MMRGESTLFRQTLLVLVGALIARAPGQLPRIHVVTAARGQGCDIVGRGEPACRSRLRQRESGVGAGAQTGIVAQPRRQPIMPGGMRTDTLMHAQLAQVLGVPDSAIRLGWDGRQRDSARSARGRQHRPAGSSPGRRRYSCANWSLLANGRITGAWRRFLHAPGPAVASCTFR